MADNDKRLLCLRGIGFSLFWAWLFLVAVSPSPLFGQLTGLGNAPFETPEVALRIACLITVLALSRLVPTHVARWAAVIICIVGGPVSVILLVQAAGAAFTTGAALIVAVVDVAMFLMWMCSFGYSKLGDTAVLITASYALGSLLCLTATALGPVAMLALAVGAAPGSGIIYVFAIRRVSADKQAAPTEASSSAAPETPAPALSGSAAPSSSFNYPAADKRAAVALAIYAFVFAAYSSVSTLLELPFASGPLMQSACCIAVFIVVCVAVRIHRESRGLYDIYRAVPLLFTLGLCAFLLDATGFSMVAGALVLFAYNAFEALTYNDYVNAAKSTDGALLQPMAFVRLVASLGILLGWVAGPVLVGAAPLLAFPIESIVSTVGIVCIVATATLVCTDRQLEGLSAIARDRAVQEKAEAKKDRESFIPAYVNAKALSKREAEVLVFLLQGRTMQYAADKLFIAESTVRTHVHNIYRKTETHNRMQLLDDFESFCTETESGDMPAPKSDHAGD